MTFAEKMQAWQESLQGFDINDLDFESVGTWPMPVKVIIWVLVFIGCMAAGYNFHIKDLNANLEMVRSQETKLKDEFKSKAFQAANLGAYRQQMEEMEASFSGLVGQLPSDTEVPGLLEDITNRGLATGLSFKRIDLQPERKREFYVELPIEIEALGTYHDMGAFVSGVAGLPRIVTLHDFIIEPSKTESGRLLITIVAKTFRYRDASQEPLPSSGKKGPKNKKRKK
jgi:type IV pilus assembly protein PilO